MADLEKTVKIIFAGEDQISKTINSIGGGLDSLSANVVKATQPLADFTDIILKVDVVLLALAAGGLALATKTAGDFADSFAEISTLIDAPAEKLDDFRGSILDYSRESVSGFESITGSIYQIISATGDWENSLKTLEAAEKLNVAGAGELDETTKLLVTSLNAFGKSADDASDFTDILFTTVKVGVTNLTELSASLGTVTGLASSAGVPFDDLNAAVGALTGTVGNTALAITQIKGILTAVIKPSEQAKKAAEDLGIAFDVQTLSAMGLDKFLQMVFEATNGNSAAMAKLFGRVEGLNGALVLGADTSGKYAVALDEMAKRAGAVEVAFNKMAENFEFVNQKIINNLKATLIDIGLPLLDEWAGIAEGITGIFQGISVGIDDGAFDPVFDLVEQFGEDIGDVLQGIAAAMPEALGQLDWAGLEAAFKTLGDAAKTVFKDIFGDLDLTDADDLANAIQKAIKAIEALISTTAGIVKGLAPFLKGLSEVVDEILDMDAATFETIGEIAGFGKGVNVLAEQIPKLTGVLKILTGAIGLLSITQLPALVSGLGFLGPAIATAALAVGPFILALGGFASGYAFGDMLYKNSEQARLFGDFIGEAAFRLTHFGQTTETVTKAELERVKALEDTRAKTALIVAQLDEWPETIKSEITTNYLEVQNDFMFLNEELKDLGEGSVINLSTSLDKAQVDKDVAYITTIVDGKEIKIPVALNADDKSIDETKKKIEAATPSERITIAKLGGEIEVELAKIEAQADVLKTAFEWKAKLDIAEVQAGVERLATVADLIKTSFEDTGTVLVAMVGALSDASGYAALVIQKALEDESARRDELLVLTKALTQAEIDLTNARTAKIESGEGLIKIDASGVYPELELVLQKIIERAQIQATAEGTAFLLG